MTHVCSVKRLREAITGLPDEARVMIQLRDSEDIIDCDIDIVCVDDFTVSREHQDVVIRIELTVYDRDDVTINEDE